MSAKLKSVIFIVVLCVVCSVILTFGATALKAPQERNAMLDRQTHVLRAAGMLSGGKPAADEIRELYNRRIAELYAGAGGGLAAAPDAAHTLHFFAAYDYEGRNVTDVILPFTVKGVWGDISGYLALNTALDTVTGFTVYDQNETAGLGAEIAKAWFLNQWQGKKLYNDAGELQSVIIAKGPANTAHPDFKHMVDGISGATNTGKVLAQGLRQKLLQQLPELQKVDWASLKR